MTSSTDRLSAALAAANAGYRIERFLAEIKPTAKLPLATGRDSLQI